jgi:UTP--glucose-1-phosphate uridylyltransferase
MAKQVRKAVIAAAGFGTRFLPQTKALPKEMLPLVDKPIIQHIVEELAEAGIEDIVIVTGYHKRSIEDHFDHISADLRVNLKQGNKFELLEETKKISGLANFAYVRQKGPYGNATPLLNIEHLIGDEPFIYTWGDDFINATPPRFSQMVSLYQKRPGIVLACIKAKNEEDYKKYGFVGGKEEEPGLIRMNKVIEKPGNKEASPSNIATVSGPPSSVWALEIKNGKFYDTGNKMEYLKTVIDFALEREDLGDGLRNYLKEKLSE